MAYIRRAKRCTITTLCATAVARKKGRRGKQRVTNRNSKRRHALMGPRRPKNHLSENAPAATLVGRFGSVTQRRPMPPPPATPPPRPGPRPSRPPRPHPPPAGRLAYRRAVRYGRSPRPARAPTRASTPGLHPSFRLGLGPHNPQRLPSRMVSALRSAAGTLGNGLRPSGRRDPSWPRRRRPYSLRSCRRRDRRRDQLPRTAHAPQRCTRPYPILPPNGRPEDATYHGTRNDPGCTGGHLPPHRIRSADLHLLLAECRTPSPTQAVTEPIPASGPGRILRQESSRNRTGFRDSPW